MQITKSRGLCVLELPSCEYASSMTEQKVSMLNKIQFTATDGIRYTMLTSWNQ